MYRYEGSILGAGVKHQDEQASIKISSLYFSIDAKKHNNS